MRLHTLLSPADIAALRADEFPAGSAAAVFDILRATSTMATAFAHGIAAIHPAADIETAREWAAAHPGWLLGGERRGEKISGFNLGNSPLEHRDRALLEGRSLVTTTTNGTVALCAARNAGADTIIAASFLNIAASAAYLARLDPEDLFLVCAGTDSLPSYEDILAAGAMSVLVPAFLPKNRVFHFTDATLLARDAFLRHQPNLPPAIAASRGGQGLTKVGRVAEVSFCAQFSLYQNVPVMDKDGTLTAAVGA